MQLVSACEMWTELFHAQAAGHLVMVAFDYIVDGLEHAGPGTLGLVPYPIMLAVDKGTW